MMNYWVVIDRQKIGPLTLEETRRLPLKKDSYVWHSGLPGWVRAIELEELADLFAVSEPCTVQTPDEVQSPEAGSGQEVVTDDDDEGFAQEIQTKPSPVPPPPPAPYHYGRNEQSLRPAKPPTYLGWSIASIICCCLITGIVAVIYSSKVTPLYDRGDYEGATKASERAELWLILSITLGLVALPFQIVFSMLP